MVGSGGYGVVSAILKNYEYVQKKELRCNQEFSGLSHMSLAAGNEMRARCRLPVNVASGATEAMSFVSPALQPEGTFECRAESSLY